MLAISKAISKSVGKPVARGNRVGTLTPQPDLTNLLAWYKTTISDGKLIAFKPEASHTTQQVKGSGFAGAGSATVTGLLTTDTITASGPSDPTCSVNGTLTFPGPDCWDIDVFRDGVLWASWKGINVGQATELDASGNGHHLIGIVGTAITERLDGSGSMWANEAGFSLTGSDRVPAVLKNTRNDVDSLFPTCNVSSTLTRTGATAYTLDMLMADDDILSVKFANATLYISEISINRTLYSVDSTTLSYTGTWSHIVYAPAFGGSISTTSETNAFVEFTSAAGATTILLRAALASVNGICKVEIDDLPLADKLPTAQQLVTAGTLADTALVANGGPLKPTDRVLDQYAVSAQWDVQTLLTCNLSPGVHVVRMTNVHLKRAAASDYKMYIGGIASNTETGVSGVFKMFGAYWGTSAVEFAVAYTPTGMSAQWYGISHGNETLTSFSIFDNGSPVSLGIGESVTSTSISIARGSSLVHPTEGQVGTASLLYQPTSRGLEIQQQQQLLFAGTVVGYQGMFSVDASLTTGSSSAWMVDYTPSANNSAYLGEAVLATDAFLWNDSVGFAARLCSNTPKQYRIEDTSNGLLNKIYSSVNPTFLTAMPVTAGQVLSSTDTWQVAACPAFPARDALVGATDAQGAALEYPGPLGIDATVTAGTVYPDITIQAPLGPKFQAIDTFTNGAEVDLATLVPTTQVRTGPRGTVVYSAELDAAGILRADRVVGA